MAAGPILGVVLQDLCPRCGQEMAPGSAVCPACGYESLAPDLSDSARADRRSPIGLVALFVGVLGVAAVAFGAGFRLGASSAGPVAVSESARVPGADVSTRPSLGRVSFAERLGESLELEAYRRQFTSEDTIAGRADFVEPPPTGDLVMVIEWQSARERMRLTQETVTLGDPGLAASGHDEVPVRDLVPTAGLYSVAYYADGMKLAEGVFELLPPDR